MELNLDLHVHSAASHDGRMTVEEIVAGAREKGLKGAAICDHDVLFRPEAGLALPEDFLLAHLDRCVRIPMRENLRSLNLSNAAAVGVYEVLRQRGFRGEVPESGYFAGRL